MAYIYSGSRIAGAFNPQATQDQNWPFIPLVTVAAANDTTVASPTSFVPTLLLMGVG